MKIVCVYFVPPCRYKALEQSAAPSNAPELQSPRSNGRMTGSVSVLAQGAMVILVDARWFRCVLAERMWFVQALGPVRVARVLSLSSACTNCVVWSLLDAA